MFVSVAYELMTEEARKKLGALLLQFGFQKKMSDLFECYDFPASKLGSLKKDIGDHLDMDDKLRIYQYPLDNKFKISYMEEKKWKRLSVEI